MRLNTITHSRTLLCYNIWIEGWGLPGKVWEEGGCERGGVREGRGARRKGWDRGRVQEGRLIQISFHWLLVFVCV